MHELTKEILLTGHSTYVLNKVDKVIREWLEEKAELLIDQYYSLPSTTRQILGIAEKSLKEKFKEKMYSRGPYSFITIDDAARIAEEHFNQGRDCASKIG